MTNSQDNQKETAPQPKSLHVPSKEAIEIAARILANHAKRQGIHHLKPSGAVQKV